MLMMYEMSLGDSPVSSVCDDGWDSASDPSRVSHSNHTSLITPVITSHMQLLLVYSPLYEMFFVMISSLASMSWLVCLHPMVRIQTEVSNFWLDGIETIQSASILHTFQ